MCPTNYLNVGSSDNNNLACCNKNEKPNTVNLPTCIEPTENGNGPSIMVMSLTEETPSNGDEVSITNLPQVTTTSTSNCCEVVAAVQPGKVRKTPKTSICPAEKFSVGTVYMKEETNYQMCCDTEDDTSEVNKEGIGACPTTTEDPVTTQEGPGEPTQISEPPKEDDKPTQINEPDDAEQDVQDDVQEEEKEADGSNSASTMGVAAIGMALVGVALQVVL